MECRKISQGVQHTGLVHPTGLNHSKVHVIHGVVHERVDKESARMSPDMIRWSSGSGRKMIIFF